MGIASIVKGGLAAVAGGIAPPALLWLWIWVREGRDAEMLGMVAFACVAAMIGFCAGMAASATRPARSTN